MITLRPRQVFPLIALTTLAAVAGAQSPSLGLFSNHTDVGSVGKTGMAQFFQGRDAYVILGSGENMWATNDAFQYLWQEARGDISLAANIRWPGTNGHPHRKACLVIRQTLDADSSYADVAVHGDGLTSIQYREVKGGQTREVQSNISSPARVRIEKRSDYVTMSVAQTGDSVQPTSGSFRIQFREPFYIGLAVCAHASNVLERAEFSNVEISALQPLDTARLKVRSTLEVVPIGSRDRRVVYHTGDHIEAPNWSPDGTFFLFNSAGHLYKLPVTGGTPELVDTGFAVRCNNDHGISPDGKQIVISDHTEDDKSRMYVLPISGGTPHPVTPLSPSYWHGWSPDGNTLSYCAQRNGDHDIYTIPVQGGEEKRLTTTPGLDDGPDYSPDGKYIYFNSERTGRMQIWRMKPDGSDQEQITTDDYNNWFPHPSPDGRWIAFLSYETDINGHPANKDVVLRFMPSGSGEIQVLAKLFGGQGTINVPSWSPDSRSVAFVSYQFSAP